MSKFEVYIDKVNEYRFRLRARNGQIIAISQGYKSKEGCLKGIQSVKANASTARVVVLEEERKAENEAEASI